MITIYGATWCVYCMKAKELVEEKGLEYEFKNVDFEDFREEFKKLFPEARTIPQIIMNDKHVGGYDEMSSLLRG